MLALLGLLLYCLIVINFIVNLKFCYFCLTLSLVILFRLFRKSIFGTADEIELKFMNRFSNILYVHEVEFIRPL